LEIKLSDYSQTKTNLAFITIDGTWTVYWKNLRPEWHGVTTWSYFLHLKNADLYRVTDQFVPPMGGNGKTSTFSIIVPQVGSSNLAITSPSVLPVARQGGNYFYRLSVRGGVKPYTWLLLNAVHLINGLKFNKSGAISGRPEGTAINFPIPVIVRDKKGHSAYAFLHLTIYQ
jgi:hypothetical protein